MGGKGREDWKRSREKKGRREGRREGRGLMTESFETETYLCPCDHSRLENEFRLGPEIFGFPEDQVG